MVQEAAADTGGTVSATVGLDPCLGRLIFAARGETGLNVLLLFGRDPLTCDTAQGIAMRLQYPLAEVSQALGSLSECGVLHSSTGPADAAKTSYWLADDAELFSRLRCLVETYMAGPAERRGLFRALSSPETMA